MRERVRRLNRTLYDAGGPIVLILLIGVPILLVLVIIALIALTVYLIRRARRKDEAGDKPPAA